MVMKMVSQKAVLGIIVVIVVAVAAFLLLGGGYGNIYGAPQQQEAPQAKEEVGGAAEGNVIEIEVEATEYSFEPATIRVKAGDVVRIKITNVGNIFHTFTIDEFNINVRLNPGQSETIEFVADKTGTFTIYCIPHKPLGMVGDLVIEG